MSDLSDPIEMIRRQRDAEATYMATAPASQTGIVWGSFFARKIPELQTVVFGAIPTFEEFIRLEGQARAEEWAEGPYARGRRFARCYSTLEPDGEWGSTHIADMVPITAEQFETARRLGWYLADVGPDDPDGMALVRAVHTNPQWEGDRS